jgi:hypothetical protein
MSLLHQETPGKIEDAASGEAVTNGRSRAAWASVAATLLVTIFIAIYVVSGQKPPVASGEIVQVWAHSSRVETSGFDANGDPMSKQTFDQVLIFANLKLKNQSQVPLVLEDVLANLKQSDGILSVAAGSTGQYDEVFLAYPQLAALHTRAFPPHTTLAPGQSIEGTAFWALKMSKQEWDARQDLNFTFKLQYQANLILAPHTPVIER